jgi:DNA-directed RNA polymerase subunit RPC12/RpoP
MVSHYKREEIVRYDKEQTVFSGYGVAPNPKNYAVSVLSLNSEKLLICPFCLTIEKLWKYVISPENKRIAKCPNCKNQILFKTLFSLLEWNGSQFADFVQPYAKMGFWKKIYPDFETWKRRLTYISHSDDSDDSFAQQFWNRYKALKGESEE